MKQDTRKAVSIIGIVATFVALFLIQVLWVQDPAPSMQANPVTEQVVPIHLKSGIRYVTASQDKVRTWSAFLLFLVALGFGMFGHANKDDLKDEEAPSDQSKPSPKKDL